MTQNEPHQAQTPFPEDLAVCDWSRTSLCHVRASLRAAVSSGTSKHTACTSQSSNTSSQQFFAPSSSRWKCKELLQSVWQEDYGGTARLQHIPEAPLCFPSLPLTGLAPAAGRAPHGQWQLWKAFSICASSSLLSLARISWGFTVPS